MAAGSVTPSRAAIFDVTVPTVAPSPAPLPPRPDATNVALWGDSIGVETAGELAPELQRRGVPFEAHTHGGTAPCEWLDDFRANVTAGHYSNIALLFVGNPWGACTQPYGRMAVGHELINIYRNDVTEMVRLALASGARVHIVTPPAMDRRQHEPLDVVAAMLANEVYRPLAAAHPDRVDIVETAAALGSRFRATDRCRADETDVCSPDGTVRLRTGDGVHLCPIDPRRFYTDPTTCPVVSPGARRLAGLVLGALFADAR